MSAPQPARTTLTIDEYLAIERAAAYKSEFVDGIMYPLHRDAAWNMAGASRAHNRVNENLSGELHARLKGTGCQSFSRDLRVRVSPEGPSYYPDLVVVCGEPEYSAADPDALVNPRVIVEVLSDSTEGYDRVFKFRQYERLPSFREYVLVAQNAPVVERFVRRDDGTWAPSRVVGLDAELAFDTIPVRVPLAEVYAGVTFPDGPAGT
ncbi:MAG: Uma2 family endonuclease [Gemmataceae bacterium]|nr:Uma2 family endonuclease [Gemmataceae bacterium]